MDRRRRADAMWLAENWSVVHEVDIDESHPTHIRIAHCKALRAASPAPTKDTDLSEHEGDHELDRVAKVRKVASKVRKLAAMAERGEGQERETAHRYLNAQAERLGMTQDEMVETARALDPLDGVAPAHHEAALDAVQQLTKEAARESP